MRATYYCLLVATLRRLFPVNEVEWVRSIHTSQAWACWMNRLFSCKYPSAYLQYLSANVPIYRVSCQRSLTPWKRELTVFKWFCNSGKTSLTVRSTKTPPICLKHFLVGASSYASCSVSITNLFNFRPPVSRREIWKWTEMAHEYSAPSVSSSVIF